VRTDRETRDPSELADRYVAVWNELDPAQRRELIEDLWTEDGAHILQPPQEIREIAARPGIGLSARLEARGHTALEARVTSAHEEFVTSGAFRFRRRDNVESLADVLKFNWEMVSTDGEVVAVGLEFLILGPDGRIQRDYQFIES
jgi:hypothetical protein